MKFKQKIYDAMSKRKAALDAASAALDSGDTEVYTAKMAEVEVFNGEIERLKALSDSYSKDFGVQLPQEDPSGTEKGTRLDSRNSVKALANAVRNGIRGKAMSEGVDANGGYTVPEDIETRVRQWRDDTISLRDFVTTEPARTNAGAFTYESRASMTPFASLAELAAGTTTDQPTFERIPWTIVEFAGFLPVSNDLLEDSDDDIAARVIAWLGRKQRATENQKILDILTAKKATALTGLDDIRSVLNKTLGQAYKPLSRIYTNDDGMDYLDRLKDANGRPLLGVDPTESKQLQLRAGANVVKVENIPSSVLPSTGTKLPFIIGSLPDAVLLKERKGLTVEPFRTGSVGDVNALSQNLTLFRALSRMNTVKMDDKSWVYGQIDTKTVTPETTTPETTTPSGSGS